MTDTGIQGIAPFFMVGDMDRSLRFYGDSLGFESVFRQPGERGIFAIVQRGPAMIFLKVADVAPLPNPVRDPTARWDAFVSAGDPDALADEFAARGVAFSLPLADTHDGLRGFEVADPDGHVLFFGRPR